MNVSIEDGCEIEYQMMLKEKSEGEKNKINFDLMVECLVKRYINSPNTSSVHGLASIVANHSRAIYRSIEKHIYGISPNNPLEGVCMRPCCTEEVCVFRCCTRCCLYRCTKLPGLPEGHYYNCRAIAADCNDLYHVAAKKIMLCQKHDTVYDEFYPNRYAEYNDELKDEKMEEDVIEDWKIDYNANLANYISDFNEYLKNKRN